MYDLIEAAIDHFLPLLPPDTKLQYLAQRDFRELADDGFLDRDCMEIAVDDRDAEEFEKLHKH
eukprot:15176043-Alexandrium_andersonii.AAC.1